MSYRERGDEEVLTNLGKKSLQEEWVMVNVLLTVFQLLHYG